MDWKRNRFGEIVEWEDGEGLEKGDDIWYEKENHRVFLFYAKRIKTPQRKS